MICPECGFDNPVNSLCCQKCLHKFYLAKLRIIYESGKHETQHLLSRDYKIGRGEENNIVISDFSVSRYHADLEFSGGRFSVSDKGSKNGILLNNVPVDREMLQHLDCIQVGSVVMHFSDERQLAGDRDGSMTAQFVQNEFFKLTENVRTDIAPVDLLPMLLDLTLSLLHADKVFLFAFDTQSKPYLKCGKDSLDMPVDKHNMKGADWQLLSDTVKSSEAHVLCQGEKFIGIEVLLGQAWERISIPLYNHAMNDNILGVCYFCHSRTGRPISPRKREILNTLIFQIATVLANDFLQIEEKKSKEFDQQLDLAKEVQNKLLATDFKASDILEVVTLTYASGSISGDYHDIIKVSDESLMIAIGDVCGHGIPAALLSSTVHAAIRSQAEYSKSPQQIISNLNKLFMQSTANSIFLTLFFGILNVQTSKFEYINAGHPPPVLIGKNRTFRELTATTFALGISDTERHDSSTIEYKVGETLVMYTDGLIESKNREKAIYGRQRLLHLIQSQYAKNEIESDVHNIIQHIDKDLSTFIGAESRTDDTTVLVIKRVQ